MRQVKSEKWYDPIRNTGCLRVTIDGNSKEAQFDIRCEHDDQNFISVLTDRLIDELHPCKKEQAYESNLFY